MGELIISILSEIFFLFGMKIKVYTFHAAAHFSLASGTNISVM